MLTSHLKSANLVLILWKWCSPDRTNWGSRKWFLNNFKFLVKTFLVFPPMWDVEQSWSTAMTPPDVLAKKSRIWWWEIEFCIYSSKKLREKCKALKIETATISARKWNSWCPLVERRAFSSDVLVAAPLSVLFLHFHPPVLEPDLHLSLGQTEYAGDLVTSISGQIHVVEELLLQLKSLILSIRAPLLSGRACVNPICCGVI